MYAMILNLVSYSDQIGEHFRINRMHSIISSQDFLRINLLYLSLRSLSLSLSKSSYVDTITSISPTHTPAARPITKHTLIPGSGITRSAGFPSLS